MKLLLIVVLVILCAIIYGISRVRTHLMSQKAKTTDRTKWDELKEALRFMFLGMHCNTDLQQMEQNLAPYIKKKQKLPHNIYHQTDAKEYLDSWKGVHMFFKYRVVLPVLTLFDIFFDKWQIREIPKKDSNYLLLHLQTAFELGERDWYKQYFHGSKSMNWDSDKITKGLNTCPPILRVRSMFWWLMTVLMRDTSYRELVNCVLLRLYQVLHEEFKDKQPTHLFYNDKSVNEPRYFSLFNDIRNMRQTLYQHPEVERVPPKTESQ